MGINLGRGTVVTTNLSGTHVAIAGVVSVSEPAVETTVEEVRLLDGEVYPSKIPTGLSYERLSVRVMYDPTQHAALDAAANDVRDPGSTFEVRVTRGSTTRTYVCVGVNASAIEAESTKLLERTYEFIVESVSS